MKFKNKVDEVFYQLLDLNEETIKKNLKIKKLSVDRKKSTAMKNQWRRNKLKLKKGIEKWHKSTQGKRFHRALGRFNALRTEKFKSLKEDAGYLTYYQWNNVFKDGDVSKPFKFDYTDDELNKLIPISQDEISLALDGLTSIEKHLLIELDYFEPDMESYVEYLDIVESAIEEIGDLKNILLQAYENGFITFGDYLRIIDIFDFFVDPKAYLYAKREMEGLSNDKTQAPDVEEDLKFIEKLNILNNISMVIDEYMSLKKGLNEK